MKEKRAINLINKATRISNAAYLDDGVFADTQKFNKTLVTLTVEKCIKVLKKGASDYVDAEPILRDYFGLEYAQQPYVDKNGKISYYDGDGELHRDIGPAYINVDGSSFWYQHGNLHRDDGPAAIYKDGSMRWYQHGRLHRTGAPAVIWSSGVEEWWENGSLIQKHLDIKEI